MNKLSKSKQTPHLLLLNFKYLTLIINNRPDKQAYTLDYISDSVKDTGNNPTIQQVHETVIRCI